jgi:hypothetical protein
MSLPPREVHVDTPCSEGKLAKTSFWGYVSTFFDFLDDKSKDAFENLWYAMQLVGHSFDKQVTTLVNTIAPENADTCIFDDFYEVQVGPLHSIPLNLDPTIATPNYVINPIRYIVIEPVNEVYRDLIEIKADDYYKIREIGLDKYVVVKVKNDEIEDKYFKILNLKSSEEPAGDRYYQSSSPTDNKYIIEIDGDLTYIAGNSFSIYLTTGRTYNVDNFVLSLPSLQKLIETDYPDFISGVDYRFYNHTVEFLTDIFDHTSIVDGDVLYCSKAPSINEDLYNMYGTLSFIDTYERYHHLNISGKAAICAIVMSIQESSNREHFERALHVLYGMPVAPDDCEVVGLYESYGYKVLSVDGDDVTLELSTEPYVVGLHPFVVAGCRFHIEGKKDVIVDDVDADRTTGIVTLEDASEVSVGDLMYLKINNKMTIKKINAETLSAAASIEVYTDEDKDGLDFLIDTVQIISGGKRYPEIVVYGTHELDINYDGVYHLTETQNVSAGVVRLVLYKRTDGEEVLYNDYIANDAASIGTGFVHIPWPTHKFLYLYLSNEKKYYKAYLDAPIDTIYDVGDQLGKYDTISRSVSVLNSTMFPGWEQFDHFRGKTGINAESDVLELTHAIPDAKFGSYFPSYCVAS